MSNRAWVTLATNDSYGLGALVLAHSIRRTDSNYPAVVLITPAVTEPMRERLRGVFAEVITVDVLDSRDAAHLALLQRPELGITFTKIHCWSLIQYEKCVFLDADTLLVQNCDDLFEREELSAAPDIGWPDCFNSGVFVFTPSQETFDALITFAQERGSFDGGDQGLLNSFFSDWARGDINKHLPFLYNVTSAAFYSYLPAFKHFGQDAKIIHFIGASKPWLQPYNWESGTVDASDHLRDVLQLWWTIFVSTVHSQLDTAMVDEETPQEMLLPPEEPESLLYYEPPKSPTSEFPWHHPEVQKCPIEESQKLDLTQFPDPWQYYKGNIPVKSDQFPHVADDEGRIEMTQDLREYIWDYKEKYPDNTYNKYRAPFHNQDHSHWGHQHSEQHYNVQVSNHQSWPHHQNHQLHSSHTDQNQNSDKYIGTSNTQWDHQSHNHYDQSFHHQNHDHIHYQQDDHRESWDHHKQNHYDQYHENHSNHQCNQVKSHNHHEQGQDPHTSHSHADHQYNLDHIQVENNESSHQNIEKQIYLGQIEEITNGDSLDSEEEEVIPIHPYDDFYLRHRATIDSRGRKICSHEIPPCPPPSPPPPPLEPLVPPPLTVEIYENGNDYTGVAGNLARVVPGAPITQRDAIDELTRRQGWEAGNIDYMGADSFDNIWAKISQTLNQSPPQRTSPPRESSPPKPASNEVEAILSAEAETQVEPSSDVAKTEALTLVAQDEAEKPQATETETIALTEATSKPKVAEVLAPVTQEKVATGTATLTKKIESEKTVKDEKQPSTETSQPADIAECEKTEPDSSEKQSSIEESKPLELKPEETKPALPKPAPATDTSSVEAATEEVAAKVKVPETQVPEAPASPAVAVGAPSSPATPLESKPQESEDEFHTPEKSLDLTLSVTDSPPLANTPSKEEAPDVASSEKVDGERRRRSIGKLLLCPPSAAVEALPTPDSELEDAATLAQSIIAGELASPTVTAATPTAAPAAQPQPAETKPSLASTHSLSIDAPNIETPPAGPVSLSQIGVKPKPTIAAQIESSVTDNAPALDAANTKTTTGPAEPTKKKIVKKAVKKVPAATGAGGEAPVPPPRKKEKKPKDK